jgi:putative transposase
MPRPTPELRALLLRRLASLQATGEFTSEHVRWAAAALKVTERTVWRWLREGPPSRSRADYQLTQRDLDAYAAWRGNAAAAWRELSAAAADGDGPPVPALRTFQAALSSQLRPIDRAAVRDGAAGRQRHTIYIRWEADYRNQRWEADHKELPVEVLVPKAHRSRHVWVTLFVDCYSRLVMGWALDTRPTAATVLAALRMGLVVDPERGPFGGVPAQLCWDNGREFLAKALTGAAGALGCLPVPTWPYAPHLKGKVERVNRTITQTFLAGLPFFTAGPRAADGRLYGPDAPPLTLQRLAAEFASWVHDYNTKRPHRELGGQTPLQRWLTDATPIQQVPEEELRWMLLASTPRKVHKDGIYFHTYRYVAPELNGRVGEWVTVRYMPHDPRKVEVYKDTAWLATAKPQHLLTREERDQVLAARRADARELAHRQRRASRLARIRLAPVTGPGAVEETTVISREQARVEQRQRQRDQLRRLARGDLLGLDAYLPPAPPRATEAEEAP